MTERFDDSDMKIVGRREPRAEAGETLKFMEYTSREHFNGNFRKARALGANIVSAFSYTAAPEELVAFIKEHGVEPTPALIRQVRFLSVFSAQYAIENYLPSQLLSSVAIGELYDTLRLYSSDFYEDLAKSGAFSFYNMTLSSMTDLSEAVGRQFAALNGRPDDPALASLGRELHELNLKVFRKAINGYAFV
ncbi:MAG: hypothetical protein IK104_01890 [Clostridia bacterium]|nr:hypothetical protein [Clostridia bacterium]